MSTGRTLAVTVCVLVLAGVLVPAPVAAAPTDLGFEAAVYEEQAGDVVSIDTTVPNGSTVSLAVAGPAYDSRIRVVDVDGDGHVVVRLNTFLAGWQAVERRAYAAAGPDRVARVSRLSPRRAVPLATGPYALRLTGAVDDTATLDLTTATFDVAAPYPAPADARPAGPAGVRALSTPNWTVATGDWAVVTFHASGLGGVARLDEPPAANLVYATVSSPGTAARHVVRHDLATNGSLATLTLDYDAGDGNVPHDLVGVSPATLAVGYDTDDDGRTEVDLGSSITRVSVRRSGVLSVAFADAPAAGSGDVLVVELPVTNPETTGTDRVALSVDGRRTVGTVEYGLAGSGALGNGLDLRVAPVPGGDTARAAAVLPTVHDVVLDERRDTLSVVFDTRALGKGVHAATLSLMPTYPTVSTPRTLTTSFSVVDRRARFVSPPPSFVAEGAALPVELSTTLAPGTELRLHVTPQSPPAVLQVYVLTVDANRTTRVDVTLPVRPGGTDVRLVVRANGSVVAGPRVGRYT
jgi:hypothetical protein